MADYRVIRSGKNNISALMIFNFRTQNPQNYENDEPFRLEQVIFSSNSSILFHFLQNNPNSSYFCKDYSKSNQFYTPMVK